MYKEVDKHVGPEVQEVSVSWSVRLIHRDSEQEFIISCLCMGTGTDIT